MSISSFTLYFLDETLEKKQKLAAFLTIRDEEDPIVPSFYAFGAGPAEVQVS